MMVTTIKRLLALLLCMTMVMEMFLPTVFAAGDSAASEMFRTVAYEETLPIAETAAQKTQADELKKTVSEEEPGESGLMTEADAGVPVNQVAVPEEIVPAAIWADAESVRLNSYEQFLSYYYLTYSALDYQLNNDQLPYHTYVLHPEKGLKAALNTWRTVTMEASDLTSYSAKEIEFYVLLIYDILYQETHEDTALDNFNTAADANYVAAVAEVTQGTSDMANFFTLGEDVTEENLEKVLAAFCSTNVFSALAGSVDTILKAAEYAGTLEDLAQKLSIIKRLQENGQELDGILDDLYNDTDDLHLKAALLEVQGMITTELSEVVIAAVFSGQITTETVTDYALEQVWEALVKKFPIVASITLGQKAGKLASNYLFGTDAVAENWYSMERVYTFEKTLKELVLRYKSAYEDDPTYANAQRFNIAANMYLNTLSVGMEYAIAFADASKEGGLLGWIYKNLFNSGAYAEIRPRLVTIKNSIDNSIVFVNNYALNFYMEELEADSATTVEWEETPCPVTEEEVEQEVSELPELMFTLTDQTTDEDTTYSEDKLTYANYYHEDGTLDLAGQTLTVYGDFYLKGGTVNVNGGVLEVLGDLYLWAGELYVHGGQVNVGGNVYVTEFDSNGDYASSSGTIRMESASDRFVAGGDFVTNNYWTLYDCTAGTMKIGGNWINENCSSAQDAFELVFTGTNALEISVAESVSLPSLTIENAASRAITMTGDITVGTLYADAMTVAADATTVLSTTLTNDITFSTDIVLDYLNQQGHDVYVHGDLLMTGDVTVGTGDSGSIGSLQVDGDLTATAGDLYLNCGTVTVSGDLLITELDEEGNYGSSSGTVVMDQAVDVFTVSGDLVTNNFWTLYDCTAGTMKIGGNWINENCNSAQDAFELVFTGTNALEISVAESVSLPSLTIENAASRSITMSGEITIDALYGGAMTIEAVDQPQFQLGMTDDITFNGDIATDLLNLNGHTAHIIGSLLMTGDVTVGTGDSGSMGSLQVDGDLTATAGDLYLNCGTVAVSGDLLITELDEEGNYGSSSGTVVMDQAVDVFTVSGNLVTNNFWTLYDCTAGTMKIGGNWINENCNSAQDAFELVFTGTNALEISVAESVSLPTLTIENAASRSITMSGEIRCDTLKGGDMAITAQNVPIFDFATTTGALKITGAVRLAANTKVGGDITVTGNLYSDGLKMGANTLTVNGMLYLDSNNTLILGPSGGLDVSGDVWMSDGTLSLAGTTVISGGLYQSDGDLEVNKGLVRICGDYRIQTADESTGELVWAESDGELHMVNAQDRVIVCGDFYMQSQYSHKSNLTAGTLVVHGNFYQLSADGGSAYNFAASGTHTTLLSGYEHQTAVFESTDSRFNILHLSKSKADYTFDPDPCWVTLVENVEVALEYDGTLLAYGQCGDALYYTIGQNGVFHIYGTGDMYDYELGGKGNNPLTVWYDYRDQITEVILDEGMTSIGQWGLSGLHLVESVTIPSTVTKLGKGALSSMGLVEAHIPDTVQEIGGSLFSGCKQLTSVTLPAGITKIPTYMFAHCTGLTEYTVPETVTVIDEFAFYYCENLESLTLSPKLETIGEMALVGLKVQTLSTPGSLREIGAFALTDCGSLQQIELAEGLTTICQGAFSNCSSLEEIVLPDSVTSIGKSAFSECEALTDIKLPDGLTEIPDSMFHSAYSLPTLEIPNSVTRIGEGVFVNCFALTEVEIPASVTQIGKRAFYNAPALEKVTFLGDAPQVEGSIFYNRAQTTVCYVYYPGDNATWTQEVRDQMGTTVEWVAYAQAQEVASGYSGSTTWVLRDNGVITFSGEGAMKNYTYKSEMPWYSYADQITSVVIESGVTAIGDYAFYGMGIRSIRIPETVTTIGNYAFKNAEKLDGVTLPDSLTKLGESAFYGCISLNAIEIPASLWTVQPYTFKNCAALESVTFHEGNLQKISDGAFYNTAITTLALPDCLDILDVYSFKNCAKLASVKLSAGLTQIREACLYGTAISTIEIPEGVTVIKPYAFKNCVNLTSVSLPSTLTSVDEASFYACTALESLELPDAVTGIGNYAFRKCTGLAAVSFGSALTTIGESSFYGCTGLKNLSIPRGVTMIKAYAFKGCTGVTALTLPSTLATLGESAFHTCTGLREVIIPSRVTSVGAYCFSGSGVQVLEFLGDAPAIGEGAFNKITATAYYPSGNTTWTASVLQNYGGTITWTAS